MHRVVIDPGHGGADPGAVGHNKATHAVLEKTWTLSVAHHISNYLEAVYADVQVALTRTGDSLPSLYARAKMANDWKADLFVSLHLNAATNAQAHGFESYVWNGLRTGSNTDAIRHIIHDRVAVALAHFGISQRPGPYKSANYAVLRDTNMPAVLLEFGFISNRHDENLLYNVKGIDAIAQATGDGIAKALGIRNRVQGKGCSFVDGPSVFSALCKPARGGSLSSLYSKLVSPPRYQRSVCIIAGPATKMMVEWHKQRELMESM